MSKIQMFKPIVLVILFTLSFFVSCKNEKSSDKEGILQYYALLLGSSAPLAEISDADCTDPAPTFASLGQAGTTATCSNCHNAGNANAGFDITSYNSTRNRITVGNPKGSLLFNKINSGSMRIYNTNAINKAIYCWTLKGGNP
ncbi:MAG: LIC11213 family lipoprotein [Leptospira bouyouniensis]|uniref:Cytochrome C Planctomycete-type domain-containing protein n=1 Tax=Leptospira bouyouniensis TaxID=2484911 RepID=A0A7I0HSZ0_9LEPT|nr:hypothetical protein EHQ43_09860 [Leptospira bouyouniensis]TGM85107.1 hypothetical protein EHQ99_04940 [Leptospira bouyouniensis]